MGKKKKSGPPDVPQQPEGVLSFDELKDRVQASDETEDPEVAALLEGARAATNAELFGVARDLTRSLCTLSRDDVTYGVLRSLEDEPDR